LASSLSQSRTTGPLGPHRQTAIREALSVPMATVFVIDTMIEKGFQILVGDANGADKAVQSLAMPA
jgi:hypothetical protein